LPPAPAICSAESSAAKEARESALCWEQAAARFTLTKFVRKNDATNRFLNLNSKPAVMMKVITAVFLFNNCYLFHLVYSRPKLCGNGLRYNVHLLSCNAIFRYK
jgi:hypothetical protein